MNKNSTKEETQKMVAEAMGKGLGIDFDWYNPPFDTTLKQIINYYLIAVLVKITNTRANVTSFFIQSAEMPTMSEIEANTIKKIDRGEFSLKKITILSITKFTEEEYVKFLKNG
jgi:hypothetical protein